MFRARGLECDSRRVDRDDVLVGSGAAEVEVDDNGEEMV